MERTLRVRMAEADAEFELSTNSITKNSLRSAFFIEDHTIISLSYEVSGRRKFCQVDESGGQFVLPETFPIFIFMVNTKETTISSRPSAPDDSVEPRKRQKIASEEDPERVGADIKAEILKYAFYFTKDDSLKKAAIPVTQNIAVSFRHGANRGYSIGDSISIVSDENPETVVETTVIDTNDTLDLLVLQTSTGRFCERSLILEGGEIKKGMPYVLMRYSAMFYGTSHISFSAGIISNRMSPRARFLGSSASFPGDCGGSVWNKHGKLVGMLVENGGPETGGRCEIIPIGRILEEISPFLSTDNNLDFNDL